MRKRYDLEITRKIEMLSSMVLKRRGVCFLKMEAVIPAAGFGTRLLPSD